MGDREFKAKDPTRARDRGGRLVWSSRASADRSQEPGGSGTRSGVLTAATPGLAGWPGEAPPQLTHALGREQVPPRGALPRRVQLLGNLARRPALGLPLPYAFQQGGARAHLTPGTDRSLHV